MGENEMNILLCSNEKYLKYASVLIASIFENNRDVFINIFYIYSEKESVEQQKIRKYVSEQGGSIEFIKPDLSWFPVIPKTTNYFSIEAYYSLFPQLYLPKDIDRILYLDIDTLVTKNLYDFYYTDFEGNILIAASQKPKFIPTAPFDVERKRKGEYFNSGVIIYNLSQLRKSVTEKDYTEVLQNSSKFFYDQGMLNYLFAEKTKYVETLNYNYRFNIAKSYPIENDKDWCSIIHYTTIGLLHKPWDLVFTDEELASIKNMPKHESGLFFIDKSINSLCKKWWEYAEKCPFYEVLYHEMQCKKEYVRRFELYNRVNLNVSKVKEFNQKYKWSELNKKKIVQNNIAEDSLSKISILEDYFNFLAEKDCYFVLISCRDTGATYFKEFCRKCRIKEFELGYRESCIVVLCKNEILYHEVSKNVIMQNISLKALKNENIGIDILYDTDKEPQICTLISQGFDAKDSTSVASIMINNIDYAMNEIGLNIVVFDRRKMKVVDSFGVNTHSDKELKIKHIFGGGNALTCKRYINIRYFECRGRVYRRNIA